MAIKNKAWNKALLMAIALVAMTCLVNSSKNFAEEVLTVDRLQNRVKAFNEWYEKLNPSSKVEAKLSQENKIHLQAKENLKAEDAYLTLNKNLTIHSHLIHDTKISTFVKNLEEKYGYDDYVNMLFFLLHEMGNPQSEWKPYLDILPRQIDSIAFNYWKRKQPIEEELLNTPILSNFIF